MAEKKVSFSIRIPKSLHEAIGKMAEDNDRNMTLEGNIALKAHVQKHERLRELKSK